MSETFCILINTCDAYSDAWYPFFRILEYMWPEAKYYNIYLNTETKTYQDNYFDVTIINMIEGKRNIAWGERMLDAISRINERYILLFLEDFFLEDKVNNCYLTEVFSWFKKKDECAAITLIPTYDTEQCLNNEESFELVERKKKVFYKLNASPTFYRKEILIKYTKKDDSPWEWEYFGSIRTWHSKLDYYAMRGGDGIFKYDIKRGGAIHRGKWVGCSVRKLIERFQIDIDLEQRGVVEDWLVSNPEAPKHSIFTIANNRIHYLTEYVLGFFLR